MTRLGFHYFPDTQHYRQRDLNMWLPRLESLDASWLVLTAPTNRSISENFIRPLIDANIQPLLHFQLPLNQSPEKHELDLLFNTYRRWGVKHVALFDKPNLHSAWQATNWTQADLVERFLDLYLPLAHSILNAYLTPIFPPLEPGGDYWDTAFLHKALQSLRRRGQQDLLDQLIIGAYSYPGENPIQWGAGGPERWPNARPYFTPPGVEDQRGFRIFDWYTAISQATLSSKTPIILFGAGYPPIAQENVDKNMIIARLLAGEYIEGYESIPKEVIGCAFWPLMDLNDGTAQGWFHTNGEHRTQADVFHKYIGNKSKTYNKSQTEPYRIDHYLLLPSYEWGISDFHLDFIRPIIKKYKPTIGFSLEEAKNAKRVTVIGGEESFSEASLNKLRGTGITVRRIHEDGTNIASILANF